MIIPKTIPGFSLKKTWLTCILTVSLIANSYSQDSHVIDSLENVIRTAKEDSIKVKCLLQLSSEYFNEYNFSPGLKFADSALVIAMNNGFKPQSAKALFYKGHIYDYQGNYPEALKNYLLALELFEEVGDKSMIVKCHNRLYGYYYSVSGDSIQARIHIEAAMKIAEESGDKPGLANTFGNIGIMQFTLGNYAKALENFHNALDLYEEIDNKSSAATAYQNIGAVQKEQGNYPDALSNFKMSLKINKELADKGGIAASTQAIGSIYALQGEYLAALECYTDALVVFNEIGDLNNVAKANSLIANIYNYQGNYPQALEFYYSALKVAEEIGAKKTSASCYVNIGTIFNSQGDQEEALKNFNIALKTFIEIGDQIGISSVHNNIGIIDKNQGKYQEALDHYSAALKIREEIGDKAGMADTYSNISNIYEERGEYSEALKFLFLSFSTNEELGNRSGKATTLNNIGIIYKKKGNYADARKYINDGLNLALKIGTKSEIKQSYKELYKLDSTEANFQKALEHYKLYIIFNDSLSNEESQLRIADLKLQYETEKKDQEIELLNKDNEIKSLQLSKQKAIRHGMIAGIVLLLVTGFLLFRSFRLRKKLEQQQAIISERKRISADLHDDVGSGLSRIMLLTELVKNEAKTPEMKKEAEKIAAISKELSANISEIIWALNANNDYLESLMAYIRRYAAEFFDDSAVNIKITSTGQIAGIPISGELRREIFYTVKEALHNIYKHSQASEAKLGFAIKDETLTIVINDNGTGIPEKESGRYGNGLTNMKQRMVAVRGQLQIENHEGTKITLEVPVR